MSSLDLPVTGKRNTQPRPATKLRRPLPTRWISTLTLASLLLAWWLVTAAGWIEPPVARFNFQKMPGPPET